MKRIKIAFLITFVLALGLQARLRFIGPDPYFSFRTFPQDSILFGTSTFVIFTLDSRGWMGNLDEPELSPSPSYVATHEKVAENLGSVVAEAYFKGTWRAPSLVGYSSFVSGEKLSVAGLFSFQVDIFRLNAGGDAVAHEEDRRFLIPFSSFLKQNNWTGSFGFIATTTLRGKPFGLLLTLTRFSEQQPEGKLEYTLEGNQVSLNRFNWGWSTIVGCNHIFGVKTNIDSFWQDSYTMTSYSQLDLVAGMDSGENKFGFRVRKRWGNRDFYEYSEDKNAYEKENWGMDTSLTSIRNYNVLKLKDFASGIKLFVVTVVEADFEKDPFTKEGTQLLDHYRQRSFGAELLPFLHFNLPDGGFFRIGTSVSLFRTSFAYREVWGSQEVYGSGWAAYDWERSWERPSQGHWWTFTIFSEADLEVVLKKSPRIVLLSDLWSHHNFRWKKYLYGWTRSSEGGYEFYTSAERNGYLREFWLGGTFGFMLGSSRKLGVFVDYPIYYDKYESTEVEGEKGYFKGVSDAQPAVRQPLRIWLLVSFKR